MRPERRLERAQFSGPEPDEVVDAVRLRLGLQCQELFDLALACSHDELAASPMRDAVIAAEPVEHRLAFDAQPRLG